MAVKLSRISLVQKNSMSEIEIIRGRFHLCFVLRFLGTKAKATELVTC